MSALHIAVVGAGIAGLAAARALAQLGHRIELFECRVAEACSAPSGGTASNVLAGAGLCLHAMALQSLQSLGVPVHMHAQVANGASALHAVPITSIRAEHAAGATWMQAHANEIGAPALMFGVQRAALHSALRNGLNIAIRRAAITGYSLAGELFSAALSLGQFDGVVMACGLKGVRQIKPIGPMLTSAPVRCNVYPHSALVTLLNHGEGDPELLSSYGDTDHLSTWPVGALGACNACATACGCSCRGSQTASKLALALSLDGPKPKDLLRHFKSRVAALRPTLSAGVDHLQEPDLHHFYYADVRRTRYCEGAVVWIGDAAHAMSPQLGMGTSLALDDALALARCLAQSTTTADAWSRFDGSQRTRHIKLQQVSQLTTPMMQGSGALASLLRPWLLRQFASKAIRQLYAGHWL